MADLTNREELEHLFGEEGVDLRGGDADGETAIARAIRYADGKIVSYVGHRYPRTQLEGNDWVQDRATIIACHWLSQRKGNPALYGEMYQETVRELEMVRDELLFIPEAALHSDYTPGHGNLVVDDRYNRAKLRVQRSISAPDTHADQDIDWYVYDWFDEI